MLELLINGVTDYAIYMLDPDGRIRSWNEGGHRIKGYTAEEILGEHYRLFYTDEDVEANIPERNLAIARAEGRYSGEGWRRRRDGSLFWASVVIQPVFDAGMFIGFAKITRDITERHEAQKRLDQAHQAMISAQRLEAVGRLTLGIAHDFNNLLGIIINALDMSSARAQGDVKLQRLLATADQAAARGALLTRQLLAFTRAQTLSPHIDSLTDLVAKSADLFRRACGPSTSCQFELAAGMPMVNVDEAQFEAAVLNLVVNASDAMPVGGVIQISTGVDESGDCGACAYVEVADTGQGMTPEVLSKATEPFFTTKEVGKGSGLGLSQVHGFVAQSGGEVRITSEVSVGTTVRLLFPIAGNP